MTDTGGNARAIPFPVTDAPHGELWNDTSPLPQGELCRKSFVTALDSLLSDDPAEMAFPVDDTCYDAESPNDGFTQNYPLHLDSGSGTFRSLLETRLAGTGLTPEDIASRARFAGSCMGCHEEAVGSSLGHGVFAPFSNGFVQVDEQFTEDCGDGQQCFNASPALKEVFLPRRLRSLEGLLGLGSCTSGGDATPPPPPGTDGGGPVTGSDGGVVGPPPPPAQDAGAPSSVLTPGESIQDLVDQDRAAHGKLAGQETLGGQPATVTH